MLYVRSTIQTITVRLSLWQSIIIFSEFQVDFMKHVIFEGQKLQVSWFLSFISTVASGETEENSRAGKIRELIWSMYVFGPWKEARVLGDIIQIIGGAQLHTSGQRLDSNSSSGTQHCAKVLKRRKKSTWTHWVNKAGSKKVLWVRVLTWLPAKLA